MRLIVGAVFNRPQQQQITEAGSYAVQSRNWLYEGFSVWAAAFITATIGGPLGELPSQPLPPEIKLGNEANFYDDDRETTEQAFWKQDPCMSNCTSEVAKIIGRARALDVTPEAGSGPKVE